MTKPLCGGIGVLLCARGVDYHALRRFFSDANHMNGGLTAAIGGAQSVDPIIEGDHEAIIASGGGLFPFHQE